MISIGSFVRQGQHWLHRIALDSRAQMLIRAAGYIGGGFCLSAASLMQQPLPLAMCMVWACSGWSAVLAAAGALVGYRLFWARAAQQSLIWLLSALLGSTLLQRLERQQPLLIPAAAALTVAATGLAAQLVIRDSTPVGMYLLRIALAGGGTWLFGRVRQGRNPMLDWLACGLGVLALAQIVPVPYLGLGFLATGAVVSGGAFPAAALSGLALDLAQVTRVPMAAVAVSGYLVRFLPLQKRWLRALAPAVVYPLVMVMAGAWDLQPLPGLFLGGIIGAVLPAPGTASHRRGETGVAQVRLELAAGVLAQTQQMLLEVPENPVDEDALVNRAAERACSSCPARKGCKDIRRIGQLPGLLLHKPLLQPEELPILCRKSGRFLAELHRSQEQLRSIRADRERQREYRAAVVQQYRFLTDFLQDLADSLPRRAPAVQPFYEPRVLIYGNRPEQDNGDRCLRFAGTLCRYYLVLCDGMGTGLGAVQEARTAGQLLRRLLSAGYPAEHALQSLNSLCALRERAGAVTVDLAEIELFSGRITLYKWGAAPSYVVGPVGAEKIGTAGPPPGLSVTQYRETTYRLSLQQGQTLVMLSDGVGEEEALRCCTHHADRPPGELAAALLSCSVTQGEDDATVMTLRLEPALSRSS